MALLSSSSGKYKGVLLLCAVGLVGFALSTVYGKHGLLHLFEVREDYRQADRAVTQLQHDNARLQERVRHLETDNRYIEKLARERLDMAKQGEVTYRLDPQPDRDPTK